MCYGLEPPTSLYCFGAARPDELVPSTCPRPALAQDPRFRKNVDRVRNRDALIPLLEALLKQRKVREWVELLEPIGVPVGPINDLEQVFEHPQLRSRGLKLDVPHPTGGSVPLVANPIKMSLTPVVQAVAPPTLGQHTREVLQEQLGISQADFERLREAGIV